jgi:hypothetical protein
MGNLCPAALFRLCAARLVIFLHHVILSVTCEISLICIRKFPLSLSIKHVAQLFKSKLLSSSSSEETEDGSSLLLKSFIYLFSVAMKVF